MWIPFLVSWAALSYRFMTLTAFRKSIMCWYGTNNARHMPLKVMPAHQARLESVLQFRPRRDQSGNGHCQCLSGLNADGAITGQVARRFIGKDAFRKWILRALPCRLPNIIIWCATRLAGKNSKGSFLYRTDGQAGPVLIDIPKDVFTDEIEYHAPGKVDVSSYKFTMKGHPAQIQKAAAMINSAQKPVIIAGRGVIISQAFDELKELAEKAQIPVVTTLLVWLFPESHVLSYRWLGMHGMAAANLAVSNSE